jgi:hypothetical protein
MVQILKEARPRGEGIDQEKEAVKAAGLLERSSR